MKIHVHGRFGSDGATGRSKGARIAVALLATAALCLGPAVAASADDAVDPAASSDTAAAEVQVPVVEEVVEEPVVEEATEEPAAPVEEVMVEEAAATVAEEPVAESSESTSEPEASSSEETDAADQAVVESQSESSANKSKDDECWNDDDWDNDDWKIRGDRDHDPKCPEPPDDCWNDDDSPRMLSGDRRGSDCPEPPNDCWNDSDLVQFKGGDGRGHDCPEPPECPVYDSQELPSVQNAEQTRGGGHHDPECPKPPECPTPEDPTSELPSLSGTAKWDGGGDKWECPKQPEISVDPGDCIAPTDGESEYSEGSESLVVGSNLRPGRDYLVTVTSGEGTVFSEEFEADGDGMVYAWVWISWPDTYTATISSTGHHQVSASTEFKIAECPPVLRPQLSATAVCVSGELQATISGSDLAAEESYPVVVSGPNGFMWNGSLTGSEAGTAETTVVLGEVGNYVASMEGAAAVEFTATKTCTENTVIVTKTPPALAETGVSDENSTGGLLWMGLVAMVLAVGMMLEPTLRRRVKR